jgi:hypothetical protein
VFCTIWTFFYLLAASLAAANGGYDEAFGAAAVSNGIFKLVCWTIQPRMWIAWNSSLCPNVLCFEDL